MNARLDVEVRYSMVPEWVLDHEQTRLSANAVRLYAILARYGNSEGGSAFPSRATLAKRLGVKKLDTVDKAAAELKQAGAVEIEPRPGRTSLYTLAVARPTPPKGVSRSTGYPVEGGNHLSRSRGYDRKKVTDKSSTDVEDLAPTTSKPQRKRKADPLWDAFVDLCGYSPSTPNGRGKWNAGLGQLREAGATPDEVRAVVKAYRKEWPTAEVSPTAIATHWDRFKPKAAKPPAALLETAVKACRMYEESALEREIADWVGRGVDETTLREALKPPIEKLAAVA